MRHAAFASALLVLATAVPAMEGTARAQEGEEDREEDRETRVLVRPEGGLPRAMMWSQSGRHGHLGVSLRDVDEEAASELGLEEVRGARVMGVADGSPAADAGLREDDVIVRYNRESVESVAELVRLVRETPPGREVRIRLVRDGEPRTLTAEVGEREPFDRARLERLQRRMQRFHREHGAEMERLGERLEEMEFDVESGDGMFMLRVHRGRMGVRLEDLTDQLADYFGVGDRGGALVASVREDSPAADAGIRAGDVIVAVGEQEVDDAGDVAEAVREAGAGPVTVTVVRRGEERSVTVELPERGDRSPKGPDRPARPGSES